MVLGDMKMQNHTETLLAEETVLPSEAALGGWGDKSTQGKTFPPSFWAALDFTHLSKCL